jgi:hypothetical protein
MRGGQQRNVVAEKMKPGSTKPKPSHTPDLSVVIVREVGKVHTFKVSSRILLWSSIFFALFIIASVVVINRYFHELMANKSQSGELKRLQHEIEYNKRALYRSEQHLALLEDYLFHLHAGNHAPQEAGQVEDMNVKGATVAAQGERDKTAEKGPKGPLLEVRGLVLRRTGTKTTIDFRLVNMDPERAPANGYVHIIAMDKESDPPHCWAYPKEALRDGLPINHKGGQEFQVKQVKIIRASYAFDEKTVSPSSVKVLVYNKPGELICERQFELGDTS